MFFFPLSISEAEFCLPDACPHLVPVLTEEEGWRSFTLPTSGGNRLGNRTGEEGAEVENSLLEPLPWHRGGDVQPLWMSPPHLHNLPRCEHGLGWGLFPELPSRSSILIISQSGTGLISLVHQHAQRSPFCTLSQPIGQQRSQKPSSHLFFT